MAELLLGLVFCIWAALTVPGKFLSIQPYSEENRYGFSLCVSLKFMRFCLILMEGFIIHS